MGRITNTIRHDEQVEVIIDKPGRYTLDIRELPAKSKTLVVIQTNRRVGVIRKRKPEQKES